MKLKGNNLIIVNILATYARILLVAAMGLFSTRWVLKALGKEDFGLYSVVGGLIVFILFIGRTMASSVQRFYAYAIGQGNPEEIRKWFNTAFILHASFALVLVLIGIPVGNYLLDHVMNIPPGRLTTCHWVYYFSIVGAMGTMLTTPYLAMFYARQRIFELSFWSLSTSVLSFCFAWYISGAKGNLLFIYALGMVSIKLILDLIQIVRAYVLFDHCRLKKLYFFNKKYSFKLISFAGWTLFGVGGSVLRNQGIALLINIFSGPKVNAAFGIANQVAAQTSSITMSLYQAISPEITSREGAGQRQRMISLSLRASKFAMLLTLIWLVPLYIEMDYVLELWLKDVPEFASTFCRIILIAYFIDKLTIGYMGAIKAHGNIAGYQATLGGALILTFPLAWFVYYMGGTPSEAISMTIITSTICSLGRIWWVKHLMGVPFLSWFKEVFLKFIYVGTITFTISIFIQQCINTSFLRVIVLSILSCALTVGTAWIMALDRVERDFVKNKISAIRNRMKNH